MRNVMRRARSRQENAANTESGFTLIELLIVCVVTPLLVGALSLALMGAFQLQGSVSDRLTDTGDAQVVASAYQNDVQSAQYITTQSTGTPQCGGGTQLLGLEWGLNKSTGIFQTVVSYDIVDNGGTPDTNSLVREECDNLTTNSGVLTANTTSTLSYDMPASQSVPTVTCVPTTLQPTPIACTQTSIASELTSQWVATQNISSVKFDITEPKTNYEYTLLAVPADSATVQSAGTPISSTTTTSCGFATPNTGTYASTLCFVDFSALNNSQNMAVATSGVGCGLEMSAALPNSYTLYFCIAISGSPLSAVGFPTYSDAFLGNSINGTPFYIGVPGDPALYQYQSGSLDTVTISNIIVNNPQGTPATGWAAVGSDAETTDPSESISFSSNVDLSLLNNTPTSPMGDACNLEDGIGNPEAGETDLTGVGTTTITCKSTWQANTPRTGTPMVWAQTPSTFTLSMQGSGLEGLSFGMLLS